MLLQYIQSAMHGARYERLDEGEGFYGEISDCPGIFANASTPEACREQLAEVLEHWIMLRLSRGLALPIIDGLELRICEVA
jgi:predicted RNase H-like HicB family nuclease